MFVLIKWFITFTFKCFVITSSFFELAASLEIRCDFQNIPCLIETSIIWIATEMFKFITWCTICMHFPMFYNNFFVVWVGCESSNKMRLSKYTLLDWNLNLLLNFMNSIICIAAEMFVLIKWCTIWCTFKCL